MSDFDQRVAAAIRVRGALDAVAGALEGARLDDLLAAESELARSLAVLVVNTRPSTGDRDTLVKELARLRAALIRCRRLGHALTELVRVSFSAYAPSGAYDRGGETLAPGRGRELEARA